MSLRILIVGGDPVARAGLRRLLAAHATAIAEADGVGGALLEARRQQPDVVLVDGVVPIGPAEAVDRLLAEAPDARALVLSPDDDPGSVREAFGAGACGYLPDRAADATVVAAVRALAAGEGYVDPGLGARTIAAEARRHTGENDDHLTSRQREVLRLLALGHTNHEIAEKLVLSVRTVETHRAHVMQKLRISSRAGLVRYAIEHGLLDAEG